jgi:hypothetical protein
MLLTDKNACFICQFLERHRTMIVALQELLKIFIG